MGHFMLTETWRVTQTMTYVCHRSTAKRCYLMLKPRGYFHQTQLGVVVYSCVHCTHRNPSPNGFVSYFDPLTKYCLATHALIELATKTVTVTIYSVIISGWVVLFCKRDPARGPSPSNSKCTQAGSTCIQSLHWTLFYKSLANLITTQGL